MRITLVGMRHYAEGDLVKKVKTVKIVPKPSKKYPRCLGVMVGSRQVAVVGVNFKTEDTTIDGDTLFKKMQEENVSEYYAEIVEHDSKIMSADIIG